MVVYRIEQVIECSLVKIGVLHPETVFAKEGLEHWAVVDELVFPDIRFEMFFELKPCSVGKREAKAMACEFPLFLREVR